jgi:carbamate kinase
MPTGMEKSRGIAVPKEIVELEAIRSLIEAGVVTISSAEAEFR